MNHPHYREKMRIPSRFAPVLFSAVRSVIMLAIVTEFVLVTSHGFHRALLAQWLESCVTTWLIAFAAIATVARWVRNIVGRMTVQQCEDRS